MSHARDALTQAGWESHQRLHRHAVFTPLMRPSLTRAQYVRALCALWGFHAPLERRLSELGLPGGRLDALRSDLTALDVVEIPVECAGAFMPADRVGGLAARWLLDGSARGGQAMAPNIRHALGLNATRGATFFFCPDPLFHDNWRRFCETLDNELAEHKHLMQACRDAAALFGSLEIWLDEVAA